MGNRRSLPQVLRDMAEESQKELDEIVRVDQEERGYSEGAREELSLRVEALIRGASAIEDLTS